MNYIGSKLSLLSFIEDSIVKVVGKSKSKKFCDLFAGTGAVGSHFKKLGYSIIANDIQYYSYVLNRHYIGNHRKLHFTNLLKKIPKLKESGDQLAFNNYDNVCNYLSSLKGEKGFIYKNYCPSGTKNKEVRKYFSDENGMLCDAVRKKIEQWHKEKTITDDEYFFLLTSLLKSVDKYANTASVYAAFLKKIKSSAQQKLKIQAANLIENDNEHEVYNKDVNSLISEIEGDIFYLDPPYNHRQYATNYHILETIAKYDNPKLHGKTGLRDYGEQKSLYCSKSMAKDAFERLIQQAKAEYIFLSYNNEGLMTHSEIKTIMETRGKYGYFTREYNRYKADNGREYSSNKTTEYLHYVICN